MGLMALDNLLQVVNTLILQGGQGRPEAGPLSPCIWPSRTEYGSVGQYDPLLGIRMKIGLVTPSWPGDRIPNGISTAVAFMVEGLEALRHGVAIIPLYPSGQDDPRCVALPDGRAMQFTERVMSKLGWGEPWHTVFAERIAAAAQAAIRSHGIEVLVMEETQGWAGVVQGLLPIPVIMTLHGPWFIQTGLQIGPVTADDRRRERREAAALRRCAGITSPSRDILDRVDAQVPGLTALRTIIPNSIGLKPAVAYETLSDRQRKSILFVGRHDHRKGADVLLQSFEMLIRQGQDAYLTFVGPDGGVMQADGRSVMFPEALARLDTATQARITYLGAQTKEEIGALRQQHFVSVVASRYETFSYVLLEALASGAAAISTAAGGPCEIIRDGETGLLIPPEDPAAMAQACRRLLNDPALAAALGQAARRDVEDRFGVKPVAADLVTFCQDVIRKTRT